MIKLRDLHYLLAIAEHRHWLVRLAGLTVGIVVPVDLNEIDDDVDWVRRLAPEYPALQIPPRHATPALLESLATAPDSIWSGSLGTTRKILQALLAYRTTAGTFEEIVVEGGAEDGEFVPIIASTSASNATAPEERSAVRGESKIYSKASNMRYPQRATRACARGTVQSHVYTCVSRAPISPRS